jgi:hypothetical protein
MPASPKTKTDTLPELSTETKQTENAATPENDGVTTIATGQNSVSPQPDVSGQTPVNEVTDQNLSLTSETSPSTSDNQALPPTSIEVSPESDIIPDSGEEIVTEESHPTKWIVIIVVLVLLIIALTAGAFYYFTQYKYPQKELISPQSQQLPSATPPTEQPITDHQTRELENVSQSDQPDEILVDLENTDFSQLDQELTEIENQLP